MIHARSAREDRFREPTLEQLRAGLQEDAREAFDRLRDHLAGLDDVTESFGWHGSTWGWCLEYRIEGEDGPMAMLAAMPDDPQLIMPIDKAFVDQLPVRRLKRGIRDGLELGLEPFDVPWAIWSVHPPNILDELVDLINRRRAFSASKTG